ncbi:hypothetical protein L0668_05530 [Paraglaciecola aquimarina]|uniref:Transposase n=1 Tax=Paraglaciecola algarum TaxID=3050085 RepID=A0ABS9D476_9ALTE|nr:hypothetical protein [Paraglaciecola sp. G1-23]MCF2947560.1 hypothetical protein [Paraglaciecola sp. G1-23]
MIEEVGGYGKLSASQKSSYNDNRKSISACVAEENYEKQRGTAKKEQDRLVELQQENQKIKLELTKQQM